jgi:hypothetical protein
MSKLEESAVKKCSTKSIMKNEQDISVIESVVHKLPSRRINLYYLNGIEKGQLLVMNKTLIIEVMRVVAKYQFNS